MGSKLNILYIANRINSTDGSAVHGRAFVKSIKELGHNIMTYPPISAIDYRKKKEVPATEKNLWYYLRKINLNLIKSYLHRSNAYVSEALYFVDGLFTSIKQRKNIQKILEEFNADVIIFRYIPFNLAPFWVSKAAAIPLVLEVNSLPTMENKMRSRRVAVTKVTKLAEEYAIRSADALFAVSNPILERIKRYDSEKPSMVVENGVDCNHFDPLRCPKDEAKEKLGLRNKIVVGYVGSYMPWHDLDTTLETLRILLTASTDYRLVMVGHGIEYERIRKKVDDMQLSQYVTFIYNVPHEKVIEYLAAFDIALMSYPQLDDFYFSPLKMFEYLAMELTVVVTNIGQIRQVITHGKDGILIDSPTADKFADAILNSGHKKKDIGIEARKLVQNKYSWIINAEKILELSHFAIERKKDDGVTFNNLSSG